jgi:hypothetical protein
VATAASEQSRQVQRRAGRRPRLSVNPLLAAAMLLLTLGQHLRGRHATDQDLAGVPDPGTSGVLGAVNHLELGVQVGKPPLRPLPPRAAVGKLAL